MIWQIKLDDWKCSYCEHDAVLRRVRYGKEEFLCNKCILKDERGELCQTNKKIIR